MTDGVIHVYVSMAVITRVQTSITQVLLKCPFKHSTIYLSCLTLVVNKKVIGNVGQ